MSPFNSILGLLGSFCACMFAFGGNKLGMAIAEAGSEAFPDWSRYLLGPLGALVGMVFAVRWLAVRLKQVEDQARKDQEERQAAIMKLMTDHAVMAERNLRVIEANTEALEKLREN